MRRKLPVEGDQRVIGVASNAGAVREPRLAQFVFVLLVIATAIGFAPSYANAVTFSGKTFTWLVHAHAMLMAVWLGMLVVQPWLIRARLIRVHRRVGRASFVVAPLVIASSLAVAHENLGRESVITADNARIMVLNWGMLIAFGGAWAFALVCRRDVGAHMRFMISTAFAIATAAIARVLINWVPGFGGIDAALGATAAMVLVPLVALIVMDWRSGVRRSPYWFVTTIIALMYVGYWTWGASETWLALVRAFAGAV